MASVLQPNPYQCDQCGTTNIVAAPVLYQQGTRTFSGTIQFGNEPILFSTGRRAAASSRISTTAHCSGGSDIFLLSFLWAFVGFWSILDLSKSSLIRLELLSLFLLLNSCRLL